MSTTSGGGRRSTLLALVAAVLATAGVAALVLGMLQQQPAPPAVSTSRPAPQTAPDPAGAATGRARSEPATRPGRDHHHADQRSPDPLGFSPPTDISIPGIEVTSDLVTVGLSSDGVMETPEPVDRAGWFTPSPPPGVPGATVIIGHVTWDQQPSVFFRLGELDRGDVVSVDRQDGVTVDYRVTRVGSFAKDAFPTGAVYTQPERPELRLITCGGRFDEESGRYLDNVIVWAKATTVSRG